MVDYLRVSKPSTIGAEMLRWRTLAAIAFLVAALACAAATALRPTGYLASVELIVAPGQGTAASRADGDDQLAAARAILRSRAFAREVAVALRLGRASAATGTPDALARVVDRLQSHLSVTRVEGTYLLRIAYEAGDPRSAAAIANRYAEIFARAPAIEVAGDRVVRIISVADPPPEPQPAPAWLVLATGAAAAAAVAFGIAALFERRSAVLTSGGDVQAKLGLPYLGTVPLLRSVLPQATDPTDAVVQSPQSGFAEAFRGIVVSATQIAGPGRRVFAVTSALPDEGKSTVAACLARTAALDGARVILVDCDARKRAVSGRLAPGADGPGLVEVLRGQGSLDDALVRDPASGASILPLTAGNGDLLPAETAGLPRLFETLSARADLVLVDTAPIMAISWTRLLLPTVEAAILVVGSRATSPDAVTAALEILGMNRSVIAGVVLNGVDLRRRSSMQRNDPNFYYKQSSKYYS